MIVGTSTSGTSASGTSYLVSPTGAVSTGIVPFVNSGNVGSGVDLWTKLWALAVGGLVIGVGLL